LRHSPLLPNAQIPSYNLQEDSPGCSVGLWAQSCHCAG
jgi:hypothetical protein